jgi:hypothetical protein
MIAHAVEEVDDMPARWTVAMVLAGALALPAVAHAGGWATVSLSSTPDGMPPGKPWVVDLEILQHGLRPLEGVQPTVILTKSEGGATRTFQAQPTREPGVYRARAVFPSGGEWRYAVDDGFSRRHEYPAVRIGDPAAALPLPSSRPAVAPVQGGDDGLPWLALAAALVAGLAAAGLVRALQRRGVSAPVGVAPER